MAYAHHPPFDGHSDPIAAFAIGGDSSSDRPLQVPSVGTFSNSRNQSIQHSPSFSRSSVNSISNNSPPVIVNDTYPIISSPSDLPRSPHTRRLHLRNAGFRASLIPTRRITPLLFNSTSLPNLSGHKKYNDENCTPTPLDRRTLVNEDSPVSPGSSILQEISNTARRRRAATRPSIIDIFEDPADAEGNCASATSAALSPGYETNDKRSPRMKARIPSKMLQLREITANERSSPSSMTSKSRRRLKVSPRTASYETANYIEHLESELAALQTRVDALTSPNATRNQSAKMRSLTSQVRSLRQELSGWEHRFEERVIDEIYQRSTMEAEIRTKLRRFEDEIQAKDIRIKELEWERDNALVKVREAEALSDTNAHLERRVDVLTGLLALSPTKRDILPPLLSPTKANFSQRTPRPRSMLLPRSTTSPAALRLTVGPEQSKSYFQTQSIPETPEEEIHPSINQVLEQSVTQESIHSETYHHLSESESSKRNSTAFTAAEFSRPTSLSSNSSIAASWSLQCTPGCEDPGSVSRSSRRMRRFPSGSCSLKPLILPTAVVGPAPVPLVTSPTPRPGTLSRRHDTSQTLYDPSTTNLESLAELRSPTADSPEGRSRKRSSTWEARNEAIDALEGRRKVSVPVDIDDQLQHSPGVEDMYVESPGERLIEEATPEPASERVQRRSLQFELEQVEEAQQEQSTLDVQSTPQPFTSSPQHSAPAIAVEPTSPILSDLLVLAAPVTPERRLTMHRRHSSVRFPVTPVNNHIISSSHVRIQSTDTTTPTGRPNCNTSPYKNVALSHQHLGPLSRLAALILTMKQDPLTLARQILHNAWFAERASTNSSADPKTTRHGTESGVSCKKSALSNNTGGLGWWLLGLVYDSHSRRARFAADPVSTPSHHLSKVRTRESDSSPAARCRASGADWHQFYSAEASKARRASAYLDEEFGDEDEDDENEIDELTKVSEMIAPPPAFSLWSKSTDEKPVTSTVVVRCQDCVEPSGKKSLGLWLKFSLALVLAVGVAIKEGPGALGVGGDDDEGERVVRRR
ncbi:hypothetical protein MMC25_003032 [Agyrium rufum]|nr:hypothetical protein [Agyrium rufum]